MTNQTNWTEYTGRDEQIAEIRDSKNGTLVRLADGEERELKWMSTVILDCTTHYWIIPADPLREMKVRQAMTGQPVYWRLKKDNPGLIYRVFVTTSPDWNIPNADYSFTPFQE